MNDDQTSQTDQRRIETHGIHVGLGPFLRSPSLGLAAEVVNDIEHVRNANANRLRQFTRTDVDADGIMRGFEINITAAALIEALGIDDAEARAVMGLQNINVMLKGAYDQAVKNLQKTMRDHALGLWVKKTSGVGEKQAARLLAAIGDPYWNDLHNRPRTVSELWAYCGYAPSDLGVAVRRKKGAKQNWSSVAKMRAFLIAESCVKAKTSPYRKVYDNARLKYADATHNVACERCGPKGKPALPGSPLSLGHQHARALRAISKEVLKDLWIESKRLYELQQMETSEHSEPNGLASSSAA